MEGRCGRLYLHIKMGGERELYSYLIRVIRGWNCSPSDFGLIFLVFCALCFIYLCYVLCMPNVASVFGLSIFDCLFGFL